MIKKKIPQSEIEVKIRGLDYKIIEKNYKLLIIKAFTLMKSKKYPNSKVSIEATQMGQKPHRNK